MKLIILGLFLCAFALVFGMVDSLQDFNKIMIFVNSAFFAFIIVLTVGTLLIGFQGYFISPVTSIWKKMWITKL